MAPVFSLVLDKDVNEDLALLYPELYKELTKVRRIGNMCYELVADRPRAELSATKHSSHGSPSQYIKVSSSSSYHKRFL